MKCGGRLEESVKKVAKEGFNESKSSIPKNNMVVSGRNARNSIKENNTVQGMAEDQREGGLGKV